MFSLPQAGHSHSLDPLPLDVKILNNSPIPNPAPSLPSPHARAPLPSPGIFASSKRGSSIIRSLGSIPGTVSSGNKTAAEPRPLPGIGEEHWRLQPTVWGWLSPLEHGMSPGGAAPAAAPWNFPAWSWGWGPVLPPRTQDMDTGHRAQDTGHRTQDTSPRCLSWLPAPSRGSHGVHGATPVPGAHFALCHCPHAWH